MIRALCSIFALILASQSSAQTTAVSDFVSPCPDVFSYDPMSKEPNRWYGAICLTSDILLYELWLNIVLENKADILGNWLGEVTTTDNKDFKIANENVMVMPGKPLYVPIFIQYNNSLAPPKLKAIRLNGKEICDVKSQGEGREVPLKVTSDFENESTKVSTTASLRIEMNSTASNWHQTEKPEVATTTTTLTPQYLTEAPTTKTTLHTTEVKTTVNTLNWFYTQAVIKQASTTTKPPNQIVIGNKSHTATENNYVSSQTTDRTRITTPVQLSTAPNQSSKGATPNALPKISKNTTVAAIMTPNNISNGWSGNERVNGSSLQSQPYANINNQTGSTHNLDQSSNPPLYTRTGEIQSMLVNRYYPRNNLDMVRPQSSNQSCIEPAGNGMGIQSGVDPSRYPTNDGRIKSVDGSSLSFNKFQTTSDVPVPTPNKNIEEDNSKQTEGYVGGLPVIYIPNFGLQNINEPMCGKVMLNKGIHQNLQLTTTLEGEWPWLTAIYQQQNTVELHYKYVCGGTLVSRRNIITAAHCVARKNSARPVNKDKLLIFMGKHNLRTTVEGVDLKFVYKILIYPEYDPTVYKTDLAILTLREPVTFTKKIQPICFWPEQETDLQNVVGKTGYTVGWGYEVTRAPREDQVLLQMEVIAQQTCVSTYADFFRFDPDKTFCAAYRNSDLTCNGDSGGGMVFQKGGSWYLRGVVSLSVDRPGTTQCDGNHHVFFTDVAKFLPWIENNIEDL